MPYFPPACEEYLPASARVAPLSLGDELARLAGLINPDWSTFDTEAAKRVVAGLIAEAEAMPAVEDVECGYDGEVDDPQYFPRGEVVVFTCPRCGREREVDAPEPDPDRARDEARDAAWEAQL